MNRYVFVQHQEQSFEGIHALIRRHKPGRGLRAQVALADNQVTHVYALQGETTEELDALTTEAVGNDQVLLSADVCTSIPCGLLGDLLGGVGPMWMPPLAFYVFLHVELLDVVSVDAEVSFELPRVESLMTGVPVDEGRSLLVQLAGDELEPLLRDAGAWLINPGVGCVRAFVGSGTTMVRSPDL
jgi:hypothetical protein